MLKRNIFFNGVIVAFVASSCVYLLKYTFQSQKNAIEDLAVDCAGLAILLFGQYLRASARGYKSLKHRTMPVLVIDGPYAFVRNPMYLASFLIGLGIVVVLLKWWMVPMYLFFFTLWYWPQIHSEQQFMRDKFGQDYIDYCQATPCFLPNLKTLLSFRLVQYFPIKTEWLKKEWNTILAGVLAVLILEGYRDTQIEGWTIFLRELAILLLVGDCFLLFVIWAIKASKKTIENISAVPENIK